MSKHVVLLTVGASLEPIDVNGNTSLCLSGLWTRSMQSNWTNVSADCIL